MAPRKALQGSRWFFLFAGLSCLLPGGPAAAAGEAEALRLINEYRVENGRPPVTGDERLARAARGHAAAMIERDFFDHRGPDGSTMDTRTRGAGYEWQLLAENLAAGMGDPAAALRTWISSKPHRRNLLIRDVVHAGIAHMRAPDDPGDVIFGDYWVLLLAAPADGG